MIYRTMPKGSKCIKWKYWNTRESAIIYAKALARIDKCIYIAQGLREGEIEETMSFGIEPREEYWEQVKEYISPKSIIPTLNKERGQAMSSDNQRIYLEQTGADTFKIIRVRNSLGFKVGVELLREQVELMQRQDYDIDIRAPKFRTTSE